MPEIRIIEVEPVRTSFGKLTGQPIVRLLGERDGMNVPVDGSGLGPGDPAPLIERVRAVFTVPDESLLPVLDALYEHRAQIETVSHWHESAAGFAADGYARSSGEMGVCLVKRGVGSGKLAIALHTAFQDARPLWWARWARCQPACATARW